MGGVSLVKKQTHVCLGKCQALVSDEEYNSGLIACRNESCENKGKAFVKGGKCVTCGRNYAEDQKHQH